MRKLKEAKEIQKAIVNKKKLPKKFRIKALRCFVWVI